MTQRAEHNRRNAEDFRTAKKAFVTDACTGCGGAPVCITFCRHGALDLVPDKENYPFKKMVVNKMVCKGCGMCVCDGRDGIWLTGCPWDAIQMTWIMTDKGGI